jgi:hypothetical protein
VWIASVKRCEDLKLDSSTSAHTHTITHPCIVASLWLSAKIDHQRYDLALKWHAQAVSEYTTPLTHSENPMYISWPCKNKRATSPCLLVLQKGTNPYPQADTLQILQNTHYKQTIGTPVLKSFPDWCTMLAFHASILRSELREVLLNFWAKPLITRITRSRICRVCTIKSTSLSPSTTILKRCWSLRYSSTWKAQITVSTVFQIFVRH